ncbi:hypothetical protein C8Q74DRAFT_191290 [Fomes fomentarius]|nr:hypothetical protein C8Q74DRAFT_191290 [Fomes fomentarius]
MWKTASGILLGVRTPLGCCFSRIQVSSASGLHKVPNQDLNTFRYCIRLSHRDPSRYCRVGGRPNLELGNGRTLTITI